jgi:alanine racemase
MGRQADQSIWADEIAQWAETIPYEILTGIRTRDQRVTSSTTI